MRSFIIIFVSCYVVHSKAIECGIGKSNKDEIRQALATCVKNNDTLNKIWEMTMSSSQSMPSGVEKESDSTEEEKGKPISGTNAKNSRNGRGSRIKRAKSGKSFSNQQSTTMRSNNNKNKMNDSDEDESNNGSNDLSEETANSSQSASEKCIVHCVLEQLSMTDDNGFPDHSKIINELMKDNPKREVKNFLQDTTDECFQEVDEANESDSCEYSNKLIICLAEKGKSNCADWPAGTLPF